MSLKLPLSFKKCHPWGAIPTVVPPEAQFERISGNYEHSGGTTSSGTISWFDGPELLLMFALPGAICCLFSCGISGEWSVLRTQRTSETASDTSRSLLLHKVFNKKSHLIGTSKAANSGTCPPMAFLQTFSERRGAKRCLGTLLDLPFDA